MIRQFDSLYQRLFISKQKFSSAFLTCMQTIMQLMEFLYISVTLKPQKSQQNNICRTSDSDRL